MKAIPQRFRFPLLILKNCLDILSQLQQHASGIYFLEPVDPMALGIPDYPKIVRNPMDFGTIGTKLRQGGCCVLIEEYTSAEEFTFDVNLTIQNALKFNPPGDPVHSAARNIRAYFLQILPPPAAPVPTSAEAVTVPPAPAPSPHPAPAAPVAALPRPRLADFIDLPALQAEYVPAEAVFKSSLLLLLRDEIFNTISPPAPIQSPYAEDLRRMLFIFTGKRSQVPPVYTLLAALLPPYCAWLVALLQRLPPGQASPPEILAALATPQYLHDTAAHIFHHMEVAKHHQRIEKSGEAEPGEEGKELPLGDDSVLETETAPADRTGIKAYYHSLSEALPLAAYTDWVSARQQLHREGFGKPRKRLRQFLEEAVVPRLASPPGDLPPALYQLVGYLLFYFLEDLVVTAAQKQQASGLEQVGPPSLQAAFLRPRTLLDQLAALLEADRPHAAAT